MVIRCMTGVFMACGVPEVGAASCAGVLRKSGRRGIKSHGCNRFKPICIDRIGNGTLLPVRQIEILADMPATVVVDAHDGMGVVASRRMMRMRIGKAGRGGMAGGAVRSFTHYGIAAY